MNIEDHRAAWELPMTNGELIQRLQEFPPQLPVFCCIDDLGRIALAPQDAVMNLVDPAAAEIIGDNDQDVDTSRFVDSVVIYPRKVREE